MVVVRFHDGMFDGAHHVPTLDSMLTVSVIIPAFNSAKYLGEAIRSVLEQSHAPSEIVVVDDGSLDDTREIAQKYPVKYIHQENAGPSAARNTGISNSNGELVAFLDADDLWIPHKLAVQLKAFKEHPEAGFSFSTIWNLYNGDNPSISKAPYYPPQLESWVREIGSSEDDACGSVYELLLHKNCVATSSMVVRRSLIEQAGVFDERLRGSEDYDYWIRLARLSPAVFIKQPISRYRIVDDGLSGAWQSRFDRFYDTSIGVVEAHMNAFPSMMVRRALGAALADYAFYCLTVGRIADAWTLSRRSLCTYPTAQGFKTFFEANMPRMYALFSFIAHLGRTPPSSS